MAAKGSTLKTKLIGIAAVLLAGLSLTACGSSNSASSSRVNVENATGPEVEAVVEETVAVKAVQNDKFGVIVQDGAGNTLYAFANDKKDGKSVCNDACATAWPPARVTDVNLTAEGIDPALITTITRDDGTKQLALNNWPLYRFAADGDATGETKGQGNKGVWFLLNDKGALVKTGVAQTATTQAPATTAPAKATPTTTAPVVPQAGLIDGASVEVGGVQGSEVTAGGLLIQSGR